MIAAVIPLAAALIVALVIPRIKRQGTPENAGGAGDHYAHVDKDGRSWPGTSREADNGE